jgi:hypothetical protein
VDQEHLTGDEQHNATAVAVTRQREHRRRPDRRHLTEHASLIR